MNLAAAFEQLLTGCDSPICDEATPEWLIEESGFLSVVWEGNTFHFCCWDCAIRFGLDTPVEPPYGTVGETKGETP